MMMKPSSCTNRILPRTAACFLILLLQALDVATASAFVVWKAQPIPQTTLLTPPRNRNAVVSRPNGGGPARPPHDPPSLRLLFHPGAVQPTAHLAPRSTKARLSMVWDPETLTSSSTSYATSLLLADVDVVDILTKVAYGIVGIVVVLFGLTFLTANWLLPQAAQQLQENCQRDFPELWQQYQTILDESNETLVQRPDLIQELGNKYNQLYVEQMEQLRNEQRRVLELQLELDSKEENPSPQSPRSNSIHKDNDDAIDVSVVQQDSSSDEDE